VTFNNGTGTAAYGELVLASPENFCGQISGFTGTGPDTAHSDSIDLKGINYNSGNFSETYCALTGVLTVTDGSETAHLTFDNFDGTFSFASDGKGGTIITDPVATGSAGNVASFLSAAGTNSDKGASLDSGQNGRTTTTASLGNDHTTDLSGTGGDQTNLSSTDMLAFGGDHVIDPPPSPTGLGDHAVGQSVAPTALSDPTMSLPINSFVLGADHVIIPAATGSASDQSSTTTTASTVADHGLSSGYDQISLSATQSLSADDHAIDTPAIGGNHGINPAVNAPTLAAATFGGFGHDSFVFQPNLGTETSQNFEAHAANFEHTSGQAGPLATGPSASDAHLEVLFDPGHQDAMDLSTTAINQFHQMVASVAHLH
jgi:hypothetical protein